MLNFNVFFSRDLWRFFGVVAQRGQAPLNAPDLAASSDNEAVAELPKRLAA